MGWREGWGEGVWQVGRERGRDGGNRISSKVIIELTKSQSLAPHNRPYMSIFWPSFTCMNRK